MSPVALLNHIIAMIMQLYSCTHGNPKMALTYSCFMIKIVITLHKTLYATCTTHTYHKTIECWQLRVCLEHKYMSVYETTYCILSTLSTLC